MMKNSNLGSSSTNLSEGYDQDIQEEESGWTTYFDDFFSNKTPHPSASKHIDDMAYDDEDGSHGGSGSAVSDAASCAAWNSQYKNCDGRRSTTTRAEALAACSSFDGTQVVIHKKLRFKKTNRHKRSGDYYDDSLEDTASSPVNSPKGRGEYGYDHQQGQEKGLKQQVVEVNKSLKDKGLCLVPYSMLINYIG